MQKIYIVCVGKIKESFYRDAVAEYVKRLSRFAKVEIKELQEGTDIEAEADDILRAVKGYVVALAVEGEPLSSEKLAAKMKKLTDDGKEITLGRLFPGEICVLSASCALQSVTVDIFIDSEENSECVVVGGCAYEEISSRMPEVKIFTYEAALSRFSEIMWVMQQILFMSMDKRLAIFLLDEASKNGTDTIKLTHEQIAKYMGSAREVVSRMLKYFSSEGLVEVSRGGIKLLDKKRLRALA